MLHRRESGSHRRYHTLFSGTGIHFLNEGGINRHNYARGYFPTAFDLTPDLSAHCATHCNLVRSGSVRVEIRFETALVSTINLHYLRGIQQRAGSRFAQTNPNRLQRLNEKREKRESGSGEINVDQRVNFTVTSLVGSCSFFATVTRVHTAASWTT